MKKEVLIAIFVGLSMGLIITFGVYHVKSSITEKPVADFIENNQEEQATATPTVLALHSPDDGIIQTENKLTITGTTVPNTFIVTFVNDEDYITSSDESGNFTIKVELDDGENIIRVHVVNEDSTSVVEQRLVVVSDAFEKLEEEQIAAQAELEALEASNSAKTSESDESESQENTPGEPTNE
jgi:hypothetical protein